MTLSRAERREAARGTVRLYVKGWDGKKSPIWGQGRRF